MLQLFTPGVVSMSHFRTMFGAFFAHQFDICNRTYSMELVRSHYCSIADMKVVVPPSIGPAIRQYRILWVRRRAHHRKYLVYSALVLALFRRV